MKKFLKKYMFMLVGIITLSIMKVNAATNNVFIDFSKNANISNGNFATSINGVLKYESNILGDVDRSGKVDLTDAQIVLKYSEGTVVAGVSDEDNIETFKKLADVNGDNKIDRSDAESILRVALNIDPTFPNTTLSTNKNIKSLKYLVINGNSSFYNKFKEYYDVARSIGLESGNNELEERLKQLQVSLYNDSDLVNSLVISDDNKSIRGNLGTEKVDNIYVYTVAETIDGESVSGFMVYDVSSASYWNDVISNNPKTSVTLSITGLLITILISLVLTMKNNIVKRI